MQVLPSSMFVQSIEVVMTSLKAESNETYQWGSAVSKLCLKYFTVRGH